MSISCLLIDIDPILPDFHFMIFWKIFISYPRCSRNSETDLHDVSAPVFSDTFKDLNSQEMFPEILLLKTVRNFLNELGHAREGFWASPIMKSKSY